MENPNENDLEQWHRWFAVECNNEAWRLSEARELNPDDALRLLERAYGAAFHWREVGTELHRNRAVMLLAQVHARLGHGPLALPYARDVLQYVLAHESPDWEVALAHGVMAHAAWAAKDGELHQQHFEAAKAAEAAVADPEDRAVLKPTFALIPAP